MRERKEYEADDYFVGWAAKKERHLSAARYMHTHVHVCTCTHKTTRPSSLYTLLSAVLNSARTLSTALYCMRRGKAG